MVLREWLDAAHQSLLEYADVLNDLNVFPVPDSDTGVNLSTTVGFAAEAARVIEGQDIGELLQHAGRAALEQARGNSGVLMAVTITAMGVSLEGTSRITAVSLKEAFGAAQVRCSSALTDPVAGTMISILEALSQVPVPQSAPEGSNQQFHLWLDHAVTRAGEAVVETMNQLPVLRERSTVDSGALGLLIVLVELRTAIVGDSGRPNPVPEIIRDFSQPPQQHPEPTSEGFEVVCTVELSALDAAELRHELDSAGDSVIVSAVNETDTGYTWRVHVHVAHAETALQLMRARGPVSNIVITPLDDGAAQVSP